MEIESCDCQWTQASASHHSKCRLRDIFIATVINLLGYESKIRKWIWELHEIGRFLFFFFFFFCLLLSLLFFLPISFSTSSRFCPAYSPDHMADKCVCSCMAGLCVWRFMSIYCVRHQLPADKCSSFCACLTVTLWFRLVFSRHSRKKNCI